MAQPKQSSMDFILAALKKDRKATYADIKAAADKQKLKIFPIMFGRAQALLGIVKSAKRGTGKAAKAARAKTSAGTGKRGRQPDANSKSGRIRELLQSGMAASAIAKQVGCTPGLVYNVKARMGGGGGRPAKAVRKPGRPAKVASSGLEGLADILAVVRGAETQRAQMRTALEKIQALVAAAIG